MRKHLLQVVGGILVALVLAFIVGVVIYAYGQDRAMPSHPTFAISAPYQVLSAEQDQGHLLVSVLVPQDTDPNADINAIQTAAAQIAEPVEVSYCVPGDSVAPGMSLCKFTLWFNVPTGKFE